MGFVQNILVIKQAQGEIATFCKKCREKVRISEFGADGSYTKKCACGCEVNQFHQPDEFHADPFYTKVFISKKEFIKDFKKKDPAEVLGFKKVVAENGAVKYVK